MESNSEITQMEQNMKVESSPSFTNESDKNQDEESDENVINPLNDNDYQAESDYITSENVKEEDFSNPWNVSSLFEFSYFFCPECDFRIISDFTTYSRQEFVNHTASYHPWAMESLRRISDRSLDNIIFPSKSEFNLQYKIKREPSDFDTHDSNYSENKLQNQEFDKKKGALKNTKKLKKLKGKKNKDADTSVLPNQQLKPFSCEICSKSYTIYNKLNEHIRFAHERKNEEISSVHEQQNKLHKCDICGKSYFVYSRLKRHISVVHEGKGQFQKKKITDEKIIEQKNIEQNNEDKPFKCYSCGKGYNTITSLKRHTEIIHEGKEFKCDSCGKTYKSILGLKTHTEIVHQGKELFSCDRCPKKYTYKGGLQYHFIVEHELRDQGIDETNFDKHPDNPHVQEILRLKANWAGVSPKIPKKTNCKLCGDEILDKNEHIKESHTDQEGKIKCPKCESTFSDMTKLLGHIKRNHEFEPCSICGKMVGKYQMIINHMRKEHQINVQEKKFRCEVCGKGFVNENKLQDHVNAHTGARPHLCKFCGRGFAADGTRWRHEKSCSKNMTETDFKALNS